MEKVKLSLDEQIEDLKNKGIAFVRCSEEDAKKFLGHNTYYFKLKAYENNYDNNNKEHKYRNLDFECIRALSKIDMYLREIILDMCLDIEHILKTRLVYDCTINEETDGFDIVDQFLNNPYNHDAVMSVKNKAKGKSACSDLARNYIDYSKDKEGELKPIPLWVIIELLSFGDFVDLYARYYQTYNKRFPDYSVYLTSIKFLRNASAHSNCLIYSLKKKEDFSTTYNVMQSLSKAKHISSSSRTHKMQVPVIHDFVTLLLVYNDLLNNPYNRKMLSKRMCMVKNIFLEEDGVIRGRSDILRGNDLLETSYKFICDVLKFIDNEQNKPNGKKLLKTN